MAPGTLLTNIGQFKKKFIQSYFSDGILKKRPMGSGRTGGNYDSVQSFFINKISDFLLTIRSAGVDNSFSMCHPRCACNFICHLLYINGTGNVSSAVTDNYTYLRLFPLNVFFRRQHDLHHLSSSAGTKQCHTTGSGTACLYHSFRNILGSLVGSGNIDTVPAALNRPQLGGLSKSIFIRIDAEYF